MASTTRRWFGLACAAGLVWLAACADRPRRNPLDPGARNPVALTQSLQALAGDGQVRLRWDFSAFDDILAVRLQRSGDDGDRVTERSAADTSYTDTAVVNGQRYVYRLSLRVAGEAEPRVIEGEELATPGPESTWVGDAGSGLVWRLTPDGRKGLFARGRFVGLSGLAADPRTGAAWVVESARGRLHRIDARGEVDTSPSPPAVSGRVVVDAAARRGWVAGAEGRLVYGFDLDAPADSLRLVEADATFTGPVHLATSTDGGLWIADAGAGRVLWLQGAGPGGAAGRRQWTDLGGMVAIAAAPDECCEAWVLADEGERLFRLRPGDPAQSVSLPFGRARALTISGSTGVVWAAGGQSVVAFDASAQPLLRLDDLPGVEHLVADDANGSVWGAAPSQLWKITLSAPDGLTHRTRLTGFSSIRGLAVDPGR